MAARMVQDAETLKALADPARLSIVEVMMGDYARTWTAKQLAAEIGVPPKKIYYHLGLLEQRGLLTVRTTQVVNGIIEKHYGAAQESITFQRGSQALPDGLVSGTPGSVAGTPEEMGRVVSAIFDRVHDDLVTGLRSGRAVMDRQAPDNKRAVISYTTAGMRPEQAGEFRDALLAVVERFRVANTPEAPSFDLLITIHPRDPQTA
ncbi:ArsR/SmtB family transcription factor [Micromonosporaceae bacterium Da 78-11]